MNHLRTQVTLLFVVMVVTGIAGTAVVNSRIFSNDMKGYITEINALAAPNIASTLASGFESLGSQLEVMENLVGNLRTDPKAGEAFKEAFSQLPGVLWLNVFEGEELVISIGKNPDHELQVGPEEAREGLHLYDEQLGFALRTKSFLFIARISQDWVRKAFQSSPALTAFLLGPRGEVFAGQGTPPPQDLFVGMNQGQNLMAREYALTSGQEYLAAASPVRGLKGVRVVAQAPLAKASQLAMEMVKKTLPLIALLLALALAMGFFLSSHIVRPIENLTKAAKRIGEGERHLGLESTSHNEIGTLIEAFNQMGTQIEKHEEDLKQANDELVRQERLAVLGKFSAGVAHEVKNPLNSILGYAQLLEQKLKKHLQENQGEDSETIKKYLGFLMDETRRASKIITELLTFARQKPPARTDQSVGSVVSRAAEMLGPQASEAKTEISVKVPSEDLISPMDSDQIYQVLSNLVGNALHALEENPPERERRVTLSLERKNNQAMITVADTGSGISEENLQKIFEPFFSTKKVGKGTGLGLSMCHGIIQSHAGDIRVTSQLGEGTTFEITLPLS